MENTHEDSPVEDWYAIDNAAEIPSPALLIYPERIRENLTRLIELVGDVKKLRPHVKTHKLPQVIAMKGEAGISKFKVSTIAEAEMTAAAGGDDILLAYQPVGPNVARLIQLIKAFPESRFSAIVDNSESLKNIVSAAKQADVTVALFLDLNIGMNRTGIMVGQDAIDLYRQMECSSNIVTAGLHAYDGHIYDSDFDQLQHRAERNFASVLEMRATLRNLGSKVPTIVASGTPTSRFMVRYPDVEVSAGTPVLWDFGQAEVSPDLSFLNAIVVLARVISRPTANRICLDVGHKSVASEMAHPRIRFFGLENATAISHSEEHLVLETPRAGDFPVGTVLYGIPRHVCPTVALHNFAWCVEKRIATEKWPIVARTRCISI
ncbi:MAG: D-TA family PLP-dependent enzyme [Planctomycetota bacterium]|nr:D-TA family PLP-dependent enzyme [Planctomycetota bacterium]